jgi:uncharacterized SAM-binding protein YcdF (DUF218 family)
MTFLLRKLAGALVEPSTLLALWLGAAAVLVLLTHHGHGGHRRRLFARVMVLVGGVALLLLSYGVPFTWVGRALEDRHAPLPREAEAVRTLVAERVGSTDSILVVVLGSGIHVRPGWAHEAWPTRSLLPRTVEGVRLALALPKAQLMLTGAGPNDSPHNSGSVGRRVAMELGVDSARILTDGRPRTTQEEAASIARAAGSRAVIVVTSALHMHRAMRELQRAGVWAIPSPVDHADFPRFESPSGTGWRTWLPSFDEVGYADRVMHEGVGLLAMRYLGD